jgi:hypothetical protein
MAAAVGLSRSIFRQRDWCRTGLEQFMPRHIASLLLAFVATGCTQGAEPTRETPAPPAKPRELVQRPDASGIIVDDVFRGGWNEVENGRAFEKGYLNVGAGTTVVLPDDAKVEHDGRPGRIEIYMEKRLSWSGHPPQPVSIRKVRKSMGCVYREDGQRLVIASYGEFGTIEGGTFMALLFRVPPRMRVERREGISGPLRARGESEGRQPQRKLLEPGKDGWKKVTTVPDLAATAKTAEPS